MAPVHIREAAGLYRNAQHYTEMYQQSIWINRSRCVARWLAHHLAQRTSWIKHDELIVGNRASEARAAPIFPEYTVSPD